MPLILVVVGRGVLLEVWDEKSRCQDENFLFGTTLKGRYFFALVLVYSGRKKYSAWLAKVPYILSVITIATDEVESSSFFI